MGKRAISIKVSKANEDLLGSRQPAGKVAGARHKVGGGIMKPEEIRSVIKQASNAWIAGDAETFAALFMPDGEFIVPGDRWIGQAEIRKVAADYALAYSDVKINIRRIIIDGNQSVVEWDWEDKENATGIRSQANDAIVVDFKNGQISRWREYIDTKSPTIVGESYLSQH